MTMLLIGVVIAGAFWCAFRLAQKAEEYEQRLEDRRARQRHIAAELDDVPLDWLDDLDDIRRLPEKFA